MEPDSAKRIWETALGELEIQVSRNNYQTWLEKTVGLTRSDGEFIIGVPNAFVAEYLERNQRSLIEKTLIGLSGSEVRAVFQVNNPLREPDAPHRDAAEGAGSGAFNPRYTFDYFLSLIHI